MFYGHLRLTVLHSGTHILWEYMFCSSVEQCTCCIDVCTLQNRRAYRSKKKKKTIFFRAPHNPSNSDFPLYYTAGWQTRHLSKCCAHKQNSRSLYFRRNITCLSAGLSKICQVPSVCCSPEYRWAATDCCLMADVFVSCFSEQNTAFRYLGLFPSTGCNLQRRSVLWTGWPRIDIRARFFSLLLHQTYSGVRYIVIGVSFLGIKLPEPISDLWPQSSVEGHNVRSLTSYTPRHAIGYSIGTNSSHAWVR